MVQFTAPGAPSESVNKVRIISNLRQQIWEHWLHGHGPCDGCPIRCQNQGFDPLYGLFDYDADLMIVAREPGTFEKFTEDGDGRGRVYRTMPQYEAQKKNHPHLVDARGYDHKAIYDWDNLMEGALRLFDTDRYSNNQTSQPTVCSLENIYFTNALKCSRLAVEVQDVDNPKERNREARKRCSTYLEDEIKYVDPDVIVTFGGNAWTDAIETLDMVDEVKHRTKLNQNINSDGEFSFGAFGTNPVVIPSYHWSNLGQQKQWLEFIHEEDDAKMYDRYFSELAIRINRELKQS
jgi:uracil-DNA glycosylase